MRKITLAIILSFVATSLFAQTVKQNSGWLFLLNSTKFNDKWGMHLDVQLRTHTDWDGVRNLLIRPGVTYYINNIANATLGYLYTPTFSQSDATVGGLSLKNPLTEHRIWQQFIYNQKPWAGATLSHRFRLEQRFIEKQSSDVFSQRFRYFARVMQPLKKHDAGFNKGAFAALQNELFFNVQNNEVINGSFFDQNRAYLAAGYRFSKSVDVEVGYLNQFVKGANSNTVNNVVQLALYTRF